MVRKQSSPYVVIYLDARRKLRLSLTEYALAEMIDRLAGEKSRTPGWCHASKKYLAQALGISERTLYEHLDRIVELGLIEHHLTHRHLLRPTSAWTNCVQLFRRDEAA